MTIKARLMLFFSLIIIVPMVMVGIIGYISFSSHIEASTIENKLKIVLNGLDEIDQKKLADEMVSDQLLANEFLREVLIDGEPEDSFSRHQLLSKITSYISSMVDRYNVKGISIIGKLRNYTSGRERFISEEEFESLLDAPPSMEGSGINRWLANEEDILSYAQISSTGPHIYIVRSMYDMNMINSKIGYSVVQLYYERFQSILMKSIIGEGEFAWLLNEKDILFASTRHSDSIGSRVNQEIKEYMTASEGHFRYTFEDTNYLVLYAKSGSSSWAFVEWIPYANIMARSIETRNFIFLLTGLSALIAILVSMPLVKHITNPIIMLYKTIKKFGRGNLAVRSSMKRKDEIGHLQSAFNVMADEIEQLLKEVEEEFRTRQKLELDVLQYQINPHFLFNTLESINWMAHRSGNREIGEMITSLARFFRIGLNKGKEMLLIQDELEHVRHYLVITKIRSRDAFNYEIHADPEVYMHKTLKVLLQPVVENSIKYGIRKNATDNLIVINARSDAGQIIFEVSDNGKGIDEIRLQQIQEMLEGGAGPYDESESGLGLSNLNKRIRLVYGNEYGVKIRSGSNMGTTVTITIPI